MTFEEWWATLTPKEQLIIGKNNAQFVWEAAKKQNEMPLFDDWEGGFK